MAKELERDLGLYAVITISVGAMIGSGIFVLPGLATKIAGPAVVFAYLLAGLLVLPAAVSKAEMATAMPESGGTYLFIDRAMGPLMGTVAGIGAWFSLVFKSAFALVGLGAYLLLFAGFVPTKTVALALAALLILVNILGVKQTGSLQAIIVTGVLAVLGFFILRGIPVVRTARFDSLFAAGPQGVLAAAGFVFVSYAGVTKIASVAEEVENPDRNLPIGILTSILLMMAVYTAIVAVITGVTDPSLLLAEENALTPMAIAAEQFLGGWGVILVAVTAVLALTSMANAGILSSSRYPFAMSRDDLAPEALRKVSKRFRTPGPSILLTGAVLLVLIAFVPVVELAKLASAFQIVVFSLVNLAVIALRESELEWYDPPFQSPAYPWVQLFGILGGGVLLTQMGTLPMVGALVLTLSGVAWYIVYGHQRTAREGAAADVLRRQAASRSVEETADAIDETPVDFRIMIPVRKEISKADEALLLRIGADIARERNGRVAVIRFDEVPDQTILPGAADQVTEADVRFEEQSHALVEDLAVPVEIGKVVTHDTERAVINYARTHEIDLILANAETGAGADLFGGGLAWLKRGTPCDLILVEPNGGLGEIREVDVVAEKGPFDPGKVRVANAIAAETGAPIRFLHAVGIDATDARLSSTRDYHTELGDLCTVPTKSIVLRSDDPVDALVDASRDADLVVTQAHSSSFLHRDPMSQLPARVAEEVGATVLIVHPHAPRKSRLKRWLERFLY